MDGGGGVRRLKDRLAWLLRPATSLFRSAACSSSSSTAGATTISSTASTTAHLLPQLDPFSWRHPPSDQHERRSVKQRGRRHGHRRRYFKNADGDKAVRKLSSNPYGFTTDEEDETDAFLSDDSSGFYASNWSCRRQQRRQRRRSCVEACSVRAAEVGFRPLVTTTAEAELRAVVKRSRDPYGDFRESMVEMIVERQLFGAAELQRLLRTYLSLNSPRLHPVILRAFSDICLVLRGY